VLAFEDVTTIAVTRYDRIRRAEARGETLTYRVHQEDFCQALRVHPSLKYQNQGGPSPKAIVDLLRANVPGPRHDRDLATFLDALILNWLIGGTDAHAKNYSILIGGGGLVRPAPLYDLASVLAYADVDPRKAMLAMKVAVHTGCTILVSPNGVNWRCRCVPMPMPWSIGCETSRPNSRIGCPTACGQCGKRTSHMRQQIVWQTFLKSGPYG
jgi:hypothetical protein